MAPLVNVNNIFMALVPERERVRGRRLLTQLSPNHRPQRRWGLLLDVTGHVDQRAGIEVNKTYSL